jgi:hypothetical protein
MRGETGYAPNLPPGLRATDLSGLPTFADLVSKG